MDLLGEAPQWPQVLISISLLSVRVFDSCLFNFFSICCLDYYKIKFLKVFYCDSIFVVCRFYLACNTSNFIMKVFACDVNSRFQIIQLVELRSSLALKLYVKVKRLHENKNVRFGNTFQFYCQNFFIRGYLLEVCKLMFCRQ